MKTNNTTTWQPRIYVLATNTNPLRFFDGFDGNYPSNIRVCCSDDLTRAIRMTEDEVRDVQYRISAGLGLPLAIVDLRKHLSKEQLLLLRVFHPTKDEWGD